ncbi:MAG: RNB domain-containing ribonuclease, partial [Patescibacteria group bacterium]
MNKEKSKILEGEIKVTGKGVSYFPVLDGEDYEIQPENLNTALNRDEVKIELLKEEIYGRKQAKVVEIIKRSKLDFVGTFETPISALDSSSFVTPDDTRMYRDIYIPREKSLGAKDGDKVQAHITSWPDPVKSPLGEIMRVIGRAGEHNAEMQAIVYERGFEIDFPSEVEREAEKIKENYAQEEKLKDRRDFRDVATFTIDPEDAKDFDDALSIREIGANKYEIGIHIADVSHFVKNKTLLDKEAEKRGTSIYLVDRTIPMLPEVLSNDLCSLNPNEEKFAFSAVFVITKNTEIEEKWFGKTLIKSDKRFSYEEAQGILD